MSLQVWLPLNGSLENKGLEQNYKIEKKISANSSSTELISKTRSGKITEKSYLWENEGQAISINGYMNKLKTYSTYSIGAWIYYTQPSAHSLAICSSGNWNDPTRKFNFVLYNYSDGGYTHIIIPSLGGWNSDCVALDTPIQPNQWYHICMTCDSVYTKIYINGKLQSNYHICAGNTITTDPENENLFIGGATYWYQMTIKGSINDFRIYDHCLSPREVKLLAQGLVAHYKLDYDEQPNLFLNGLGKGDSSTSSYYRYIFDYSGYGKYLQADEPCTLTICFTPKEGFNSFNPHVSQGWTSPTGEIVPPNITNGQQQIINIRSKDQWNYAIDRNFTPADDPENAHWYIYVRNTSGNYDTSVVDIHWVKLQTGHYSDVKLWTPSISENATYYNAYDCSGYGNHLLQVGNIIIDNTSPRYSCAVDFNQSGYFKKDDLNLTTNQFTYSYWVKPKASTTGQHFLLGTQDDTWAPDNGLALWRDKDQQSYNWIICANNKSYIQSSISLESSQWSHIVFVYTGTEVIVYKNGNRVSLTTYGDNNTILHPRFYIGNSSYQTTLSSETEEASISDVRLYATALTAAAVKELYQSSISFLDNGTLQTSEVIESSTNLKFKKNGVAQINTISEIKDIHSLSIQILEDCSAWGKINALYLSDSPTNSECFANADEVQRCINKDNRFSLMEKVDKLNYDDQYEFLLTYPSNNKKCCPAGFKFLEYVQTPGGLYIDTEVYPYESDGCIRGQKWHFDIEFEANNQRQLMGYGGSHSQYWGVTANNVYENGYKAMTTSTGTRNFITHDWSNGTKGGNSVRVQNELSVANSAMLNTSEVYKIFGGIASNLNCINTKLYGCQCLQDNILIRDFIPALRCSDNAVGLYDYINKKLYLPKDEKKLIPGPQLSTSFNTTEDEYQFLDYIESTSGGGQYIDTGIKPGANTRIEIKARLFDKTSVYGTNETDTLFNLTGNNDGMYFYYGNGGQSLITDYFNETHIYEQDGKICRIDGKEYDYYLEENWPSEREANTNIYLFGRNGSSGFNDYGKCRIYYCNIYDANDNNKLIRSFHPAVRNDVAGMYESITNTFYTNVNVTQIPFSRGSAIKHTSLMKYNRWIQTDSPNNTHNSTSGYYSIHTDYSSKEGDMPRVGALTKVYDAYKNNTEYAANQSTSWWGPIGQYSIYNGGIPAADGTIQKSTELWIRIKNSNLPVNVSLYNNAIQAYQIYEL